MTTVVGYHGVMVAAGSIFLYQTGTGLPVVWTSSDGGATWHHAWSAGGIVGGSSSGQTLWLLNGVLFLVSAGTSGTYMWRTTDPTT